MRASRAALAPGGWHRRSGFTCGGSRRPARQLLLRSTPDDRIPGFTFPEDNHERCSTASEARHLTAGRPGRGGSYVGVIRTGNLVVTSGQLPWKDGKLLHTGRVGDPVTVEQGYEAAKQRHQRLGTDSRIGDVEKVKQWRVEGYVYCSRLSPAAACAQRGVRAPERRLRRARQAHADGARHRRHAGRRAGAVGHLGRGLVRGRWCSPTLNARSLSTSHDRPTTAPSID